MDTNRWKKPVVEGAFVLAGILTAFAIDASWGNHEDAVRVRSHLSALSSELADARAGFQRHLAELTYKDSLIVRLLGEASANSISDVATDSILFNLGPFVPFDPPQAALEDLQGAGAMALINDPLIRLHIIRYRHSVEEDLAEQRSFVDYWLREVMPLWDRELDIRRFLSVASPTGFLGRFHDAPAPKLSAGYQEALRDRQFLNQLSTRLIKSGRVRLYHNAVLSAIDSLQSVLQLRGYGPAR